MKKKSRAIIAALLVAVMALSCTSAFAAEPADTLAWDYYGWETFYYDYAGTLTTGDNAFTSPDDSYYCYFVFDAPESGYYSFGFTDYDLDGWIGVPDRIEEGIAYDEAPSIVERNENDTYKVIFKIEKGENIIGLDTANLIINKTFNITFLGDSIESVTINDTLILNYNIFCYDDSVDIYAETTATFSEGNQTNLGYISGLVNDEIKPGKNIVTTEILGKNKEIEIDVYLISDIIKNVEISNIEDYTNAKVYYDGFDAYHPSGETFTFALSDGTTKSVVYDIESDNFVETPDGDKIYFYTFFDETDEGIVFRVMVGDNEIRSYNCTETKSSANENLAILKGNGEDLFNTSFRCLKNSLIAVLECDSLYEFTEYGIYDAAYYLENSIYAFLAIFENVFSYISFIL